jgi:hypothetical protein
MWGSSSFFWWRWWELSMRDLDRWGLGSLLGLTGIGHLRRPTLFLGEERVSVVRDERFRKSSDYLWSIFWASSFVNSNTWCLICNNFNLNFIYGIVCLYVCVCALSLHRESTDVILGDKPLISDVVLSQLCTTCRVLFDDGDRLHDSTLPYTIYDIVVLLLRHYVLCLVDSHW